MCSQNKMPLQAVSCHACVYMFTHIHECTCRVCAEVVCRYPVCSGSASPLAWPCPLVAPSEPAAQPGSGSPPLWPSAAVSPSASPSVCPAPSPALSPSPPPSLAPSRAPALVPARPRAPSLSLVRALAVSLAGGAHSPSVACGGGWQVCTHTHTHAQTHTQTGGEGERCNTQHEADINHTLVNLTQTFLPKHTHTRRNTHKHAHTLSTYHEENNPYTAWLSKSRWTLNRYPQEKDTHTDAHTHTHTHTPAINSTQTNLQDTQKPLQDQPINNIHFKHKHFPHALCQRETMCIVKLREELKDLKESTQRERTSDGG